LSSRKKKLEHSFSPRGLGQVRKKVPSGKGQKGPSPRAFIPGKTIAKGTPRGGGGG